MQPETFFLQIAIPTPLRKTFDYLPCENVPRSMWQVGQRVSVSFGRRKVVGVIVGISAVSDLLADKLKSVSELIDEKP